MLRVSMQITGEPGYWSYQSAPAETGTLSLLSPPDQGLDVRMATVQRNGFFRSPGGGKDRDFAARLRLEGDIRQVFGGATLARPDPCQSGRERLVVRAARSWIAGVPDFRGTCGPNRTSFRRVFGPPLGRKPGHGGAVMWCSFGAIKIGAITNAKHDKLVADYAGNGMDEGCGRPAKGTG